ncbi:MAG: polysaccharide biosynthesis protein [Thermoanaerobaculia bacterium]
MKPLSGKRILITGGTGSLGQTLVRRLLTGEMGTPKKITVFSRDEAKQHYMRLEFQHRSGAATDDVIYENSRELLNFRIGDVRDFSSVMTAVRDADVVFNAAALKQVPTCEYYPFEAVMTNVVGPQNLVRAIRENDTPVELVVGISTDKACKPINVMGMTKALQERVLLEANMGSKTKFMCVRYGNVIASRGSVVPLFKQQIANGGPVTITLPEMTRFLLSLDRAVDTVFAVVRGGARGELYVPKVASAKVTDVAKTLMGGKDIPIKFTGIRPGEKVHEIMVSEEERFRTVDRGDYYAILPVLPELRDSKDVEPVLANEYSSEHDNISGERLRDLLQAASKEIESFTP